MRLARLGETISASFPWSARKHTVTSAHQSVRAWHRASLRQGETAKDPCQPTQPFCDTLRVQVRQADHVQRQ